MNELLQQALDKVLDALRQAETEEQRDELEVIARRLGRLILKKLYEPTN